MLALLLLAAAPVFALDEFQDQLARLGAARAEERAAAERWLAAHLERARYPELAEAALGADAEVRGRLERVLAADERHLGLALALAAERDADLRRLGEDALRAGIARAAPRLTEPALRDGLEAFLRRVAEGAPPRCLRLSAGLELEAMVEELELAGELALGLALDSAAANRTFRRQPELAPAPWNRLLWRLRELGVELEAHGVVPPRDGAAPSGAFVRLAPELGPARTGVEWVADWLLLLARGEASEAERARAARNLAASGFAPALTWMGELVERGDRAAREGLLRAAARGRVAPTLTQPAVLEELLAEAEREDGRRAARLGAALARLGCLDAGGEPLAVRLLADFTGVAPRGRWLRLYALERNRCDSPEARGLARTLVEDPATPPALALQALFLLVAQGEPPSALRVPAPAALLRLELAAEEGERLGRALRLVGQAPPWPDPAAIPADWAPAARTRLLEAWLWNGDEEACARHVAAALAGPPAEARARGEGLARTLEPWLARGEGERVARVLARTLSSAREADVLRLRLLLGLVPADEVPAQVARGGFALAGAGADLALLGALAGYPVRHPLEGQARDTLRAALDAAVRQLDPGPDVGPLAEAARRAVAGLFAAGRDADGQALTRSLWQIQGRADAPLARALARTGWLVPPGVEVRDLGPALLRHVAPRP
ncbi:MAG TPA: hypothetical protein VF530_08580 [Planctomycetota bacterium]